MLQHIPFIARNAFRNRRRSLLTVASVAVSLCLLGVIMALYRGLFFGEDASPVTALRLVVHHKVSLAQALPVSDKQRIAQVPGVVAVCNWQWFGGTYKDARNPKNFFARLGVDPGELFVVRPDMIIAPSQRREFERQRTAAVASKLLADNLGWKIGDRITLVGDIFPVNLEMTLAGTFTDPDDSEVLFFNNDYLQESLSPTSGQRNSTGSFLILADAPKHVPRIASAIDAMFANSPSPTKSESEKDFALSFLAFLGNLKLFLAAICGAVTFTILLVSANTVAMTVRERVRETAILRTLGFAPSEILGLILGEAALLGAAGGLAGSLLTQALCLTFRKLQSGGMKFPLLTPALAGIVVAVAIVIAFVSAALPAYLASRKPVVESLRNAG